MGLHSWPWVGFANHMGLYSCAGFGSTKPIGSVQTGPIHLVCAVGPGLASPNRLVCTVSCPPMWEGPSDTSQLVRPQWKGPGVRGRRPQLGLDRWVGSSLLTHLYQAKLGSNFEPNFVVGSCLCIMYNVCTYNIHVWPAHNHVQSLHFLQRCLTCLILMFNYPFFPIYNLYTL